MVTETVIETPVTTDPEPQTAETETPAVVEAPESAAPEPEAAAVQQVEVEATAPEAITREEVQRLVDERAEKIRADEREQERKRRQTDNARRERLAQEARDTEQEAVDTLKTALGAKGVFELPDADALVAINRITAKRAERMVVSQLDAVEDALDWVAAPLFGKDIDLPDHAQAAAMRISPKIQQIVNTIRPQIEAKAREGYIAEADLSKRVDAEIARRNAKGREGQTELKRPEGQAGSTKDRSLEAVTNRIISNDADDVDKELWRARFSLNNNGR